jgi:hypothetical protein
MAKKKIETFSQCRFVLEGTGDSRVETTAYIDAKEAKVGTRMTLKGKDGIWGIESAGQPGPPPNRGWGGMD